jgi:hypothetical protein
MGKKVKKIIGKAKKFTEKWDPLGAGVLNEYADGLSDQFLGTDYSGAKQAQKDLDLANASREEQAQTFAQNMGVNLGTDNVAQVELGGTADMASTGNRRKKRAGTQSASSSLGINV